MCNEHDNGGLFWGVHRATGHAHLHQAHHRSCHVGPHHVNQWSPNWHGGKFNGPSLQTDSNFVFYQDVDQVSFSGIECILCKILFWQPA